MSKHTIKLIDRISTELSASRTLRRSKYNLYDIWTIELDGVYMQLFANGLVIPTNDSNKLNQSYIGKILKFSNKNVYKHPDYKNIRKQVIDALMNRRNVLL